MTESAVKQPMASIEQYTAAVEARAERQAWAWFPSFCRANRPFPVFHFFREYNRYLDRGSTSWRRVFDNKQLFSGFMAGIGIGTPATRWFVAKDSAVSPNGERISTKELADRLLTGRWFVKLNDSEGGHGAFLLQNGITTSADGDSQPTDATALTKLLAPGGFLVQDIIVQSAEYAAFASSSLNTVRPLTFLNRAGTAEVVAACFRVGNGRAVVDNSSSGGLYCGIDIEAHRLIGPGRDFDGNLFDEHPVSGIALRGTPVARLNEVFATCRLAHELLGGPVTIGWDVAMTDEGPCIIEANNMWGPRAHSETDPGARSRLLTGFLQECPIRGRGFPDDLPRIRKADFATVVFRAKGTVQGVGYRDWIAFLARTKNLDQDARNLDNGDVEVRLTGPRRTLEFAVMSAMHGPARAQVREIEVLSLRPLVTQNKSVASAEQETAASTVQKSVGSTEQTTAAPDVVDGVNQSAKAVQHAAGETLSQIVGNFGPCGARLTRADLDIGIDLGGRYLLAAQRPDGGFVYEVDWTTGEESPDDNAVRQAGATWGMAMLHRETRNPAYRAALDRSLARWDADARAAEGRRWQGQQGARQGKLGTVALIGMSLLERLAAPEGLADPAATRASLDGLCAFVEDARLPGGGFYGSFDTEAGTHSGSADPYSSGEALLLLVCSGLALGVPDRVTRALVWAEEDYDMFVAKPLAMEPDPDITKGYYQWGSMSWFVLASAGHAPKIWGRRLVGQALWMVNVHRTLTRTRNTAYAYEGIVPAWEWARRTGDDDTARGLACVVHQGLRKLCSWQLGHPLDLASLRCAPERFHGAVQNHAIEPALRIDVTQHQLHALMIARRFGVDAAEHLCAADARTMSIEPSSPEEQNYGPEEQNFEPEEQNVYSESEIFANPQFGRGLRFDRRLIYGHLADEFMALGFNCEIIGNMMLVTKGKEQCYIYEGETSFTSLIAMRLLKDKELSRALFERARVSIAEGFAFTRKEKSLALQKVEELGPAVIKPVTGSKGKGASVNVTPESFEAAWVAASAAVAADSKNSRAASNEILVEKFFANGKEARYLVVGGQCVAVLLRLPPKVYGDGSSTVGQLVARENEIRRSNPCFRALGGMIVVDEHRRAILRSQGYSLDSVPTAGAKVIIDWKGGLSTGANSRNITSEAHISMKRVAERVAASVPGLDIAGVDILANDHSVEAMPDNYIVVEANTRPNLSGHFYPVFGEPINIYRKIAENCARNMGFDVEALRQNREETSRAGNRSPA